MKKECQQELKAIQSIQGYRLLFNKLKQVERSVKNIPIEVAIEKINKLRRERLKLVRQLKKLK